MVFTPKEQISSIHSQQESKYPSYMLIGMHIYADHSQNLLKNFVHSQSINKYRMNDLIVTTVWANLADEKLMECFLLLPENRL